MSSLPYLTQDRLNFIFEGVYGLDNIPAQKLNSEEEKIVDLAKTLYAMQQFNHHHRWDDTRQLFGLMSKNFQFEVNSEGSTLWLSLILAIQELYGFTDEKIVEVICQVTVRK